MKNINLKEFKDLGYLQELNRQFLHPLGLAMSVNIDDEGNHTLGQVHDFRNDAEGVYYDLKNSDEHRIERFNKNKNYIQSQQEKFKKQRMKILGFNIEPIPKN